MAEELDLPWCFDDEHLAWQKTIQEFCQRVVAPGVIQRDLDGQLDPDLIRQVGRLGAFGLRVPEAYGGSGADLRSMCIAAEEFSVLDSSLAVTIHVQAISAALFHHLASEDLRAEFLPPMASGETFCAFGLTEPTGGSDAGNIGTRAVRDGSDWVINGAKQFITNSGTPFSKYVMLFAAHEREGTARGDGGVPRGGRPPISAFLVPLDAPGVTVGPKYPKMGWRSSDTHPLYFEDVRVPAQHLLGQEGRGYREALAFLTWARIPIAAMSAGLARGCLEATLEFATSRESFGKPLTSHQAVAFGIADLSAMTDTCRLLTYDAAWKYDTGRPIEREAAVSKLMASELANKVAYKASHLHGGYGFMDDSDVSRHYRDARILTIGEGTSEVQRMLIARGLGLPV
ncbi:MAG: short-chain 2-methylacyl-CoA dehydrogenase [Actinomycetota bacterium]|nr:short-chain 2-methylacyl-CoA dehydrogenase [Actinomycetota bacterium]